MIALRKRNFTLPLNGFETQDRALSYSLLFVYLQSSFHATLTLFCLSTKDILGRRDEFAGQSFSLLWFKYKRIHIVRPD